MEKYRGQDAIKVNITSKCNVPQDYTEVKASIKSRVGNVVTIFNFDRTRENADPEDTTSAYFKNLFKFCTKGERAEYIGVASGIVHLESGLEVSVSDENQKYFPQNCRIAAK